MSMRVMQVKYNQRVKMNRVNKSKGFSLNYSNRGDTNTKCCGFGKDKQIPTHTQSYGNYIRRATNGLGGGGGPASRVVNHQTDSSLQNKFGTAIIANTVKRSPNFTTTEYTANKRSNALRADYSKFTYADGTKKCKDTQEPICYNSCTKPRKTTITKDLGYLSGSQQINKKLSLRAGDNTKCFNEYESPVYGANKC